MILSNVYDTLIIVVNWGIEMLVSSFGYLNKSGNINGVRVESNKSQKPVVNQGLVADVKIENIKSSDNFQKSADKLANKLDVVA